MVQKKQCTLGEWIFYCAISEIFQTNPDEMNVCSVCVVSEPGKSRTITKGKVALKIVLDLISHICAAALTKAFPTSTSGMAEADHGWKFSQYLFSDEARDIVF